METSHRVHCILILTTSRSRIKKTIRRRYCMRMIYKEIWTNARRSDQQEPNILLDDAFAIKVSCSGQEAVLALPDAR